MSARVDHPHLCGDGSGRWVLRSGECRVPFAVRMNSDGMIMGLFGRACLTCDSDFGLAGDFEVDDGVDDGDDDGGR